MSEQYFRISKQIIINYLALFTSFIFGPISLSLLTRNLSVSEYGVYSLLSITVTIVAIILDLGFPYYIIARLSGEEYELKKKAFSTIFYFEALFITCLIILLLFTPLNQIVTSLLNLNNYYIEFQISLFIIIASLLIRIGSAYLASEKRLELQALNNVLQQGLWVILLLTLFILIKKINLTYVMFIWLLGTVFTLFVCIYFIRSSMSLTFSKPELKKAIFFSAPLILSNLGSWLIVSSGRYILNYQSTLDQVAFYSFAYSLVALVSSVSAAISGTFYPYFAEAWNKKKNYDLFLNASIKYTLIVVFLGLAVLLSLNRQIILAVATVKYLGAAPLVLILLVVPIFMSLNSIFYQVILLNGKTKVLALIYTSATFFNIILLIILSKYLSIYGLAAGVSITYFLLFLTLFWFSFKEIHIDYDYLQLNKLLIISLIVSSILFLIKPLTFISLVITLGLGVLIYGSLLFFMKVFNKAEKEIMLKYLDIVSSFFNRKHKNA